MDDGAKHTYFWFKASIALGMLLGLVLLAQSIFTYRYVANSMVRLEAKREADRKMQSVIRLSRTAGNRDIATLHPLMDELLKDAPQQIAWMRVLDTRGMQIVASGNTSGAPAYPASTFDRLVEDRERPPAVRQTSAGPVLITLNPLYVGLPGTTSGAPGGLARTMPGVGIIEIGIYLNGVSTRFGPLRENLIVGVSAALALWAAVIIIGFRFRSYLRGKKVEEQLAMARLVQFDLLPPGRLLTRDLEFAAQCVPAWQVGGDFYDAFETGEHGHGQVALVLGDVSGKGLSAALVMGVVQGAVHAANATGSAANHEQSAERLNQLLCKKTSRERFVSLVWAYFDPVSSTLSYINAGHLPPMLIRRKNDGQFETIRLDEGGPVLGVLPGATYKQTQVPVQPGDLLVVFSDGILEALNSADEEFGEDRILAAVEDNWTGSPSQITDAVLARVRAFLGKELPHDDQTLMVVRLQGSPRPAPEPAQRPRETVLQS